jgi:zinc protease
MRRGAFVVLGGVLVGCGHARPSEGIFDEAAPWHTLADEPSLGVTEISFSSAQVDQPSGLRLVYERAPTRGMVAVVLTVGAGASQDPPGKEGLAHFVEHLAFRAMGPHGREVSLDLARRGAVYNAETSFETTRYYEFAPRAELGSLLQLAAHRLRAPLEKIAPADVDVERAVVMNELRQRNETGVHGQVLTALQQALFPPEHPYARPVGGTLDSVARLTLQDARAFVAQHYRPSNATLVVVGDFEGEDVQRFVLEALPPALKGDPAKPVMPEKIVFKPTSGVAPSAPAGGAFRQEASVPRPEMWIAWTLPSVYGPNAAAAKVITAPVVRSYLAAVLERDPDVAHVETIGIPARQSTIFAVALTLRDVKHRDDIRDRALRTIVETWLPLSAATVLRGMELKDADQPTRRAALQAALNVAEQDRALRLGMRQQALAHAMFRAEAFAQRALDRAAYLHFIGDNGAFSRVLGKVLHTRIEELSAFAEQYLTAERARVLYVDPMTHAAAPAGPVGLPAAQGSERPLPAFDFGDPAIAEPPRELGGAIHYHLTNGLEVALVRRPDFPVVTASLAFNGGFAAGDPPGIVEVLRHFEDPGRNTGNQSGIEIWAEDTADFTADFVRTGSGNLSLALAVLAARVWSSDVVPWEDVLKAESTHSGGEDKRPPLPPQLLRDARVMRALYGEHPYGRVLVPERLAGELDSGHMRRWLLRMHNPRNAILVVVGDLEVEQARALVSGWFGRWAAPVNAFELAPPAVPAPLPGPPREERIVVPRPGISQTELTVACRLPNADDRAEVVHRVLAGVVGGYLTASLREEAGATYGVSGRARVLRGGAAHLRMDMVVDNARLKDVLRVVRRHWEAFGAGEFDRGAISQARWTIASNSNLAFQTTTEIAARILDALNRGWSLDFAARAPVYAKSVEARDLAAAFAICRSSTVLAGVGDEVVISSAFGSRP